MLLTSLSIKGRRPRNPLKLPCTRVNHLLDLLETRTLFLSTFHLRLISLSVYSHFRKFPPGRDYLFNKSISAEAPHRLGDKP
jgi:hypothetical protein